MTNNLLFIDFLHKHLVDRLFALGRELHPDLLRLVVPFVHLANVHAVILEGQLLRRSLVRKLHEFRVNDSRDL